MRGAETPQLLECGHVGLFAGVCQYNRCARRLCSDCCATCGTCGLVLCRRHQVWVDRGRRVFCPDDSRRYLVRKLALTLVHRG